MPDPRLLSTETAYAGRLFNVSLDRIEMDGGVIAFRETIRHPGAVCMVPVTADGNLLFVTQYRHAAGRRLLELPAGTLEPGEEPLAAVSRELQEEVGQRPGRVEGLGGFYVARRGTRPSTSTCTSAANSRLRSWRATKMRTSKWKRGHRRRR
ncbi:MAG: NUDIX hydrolase [Dehalococcoidia bacterium]|nr:NUDIX hydrolase [Dehalococcoidia bacterium]